MPRAFLWSITRANWLKAFRTNTIRTWSKAKAVDTLILILPGGPATAKMINTDVMKALGPRGVIINVARGSVVDEHALIAALKSGTILAAGLDAFTNEPAVPDRGPVTPVAETPAQGSG
jgi:lactate dehydrogenase-like 2-hydroxyacid dehydrogenase